MAYSIKLHGSPGRGGGGRGEGGPIYGQYRYVYQPLASLTLKEGIKITFIYRKTKGYILLQFVS